MTLKPIENEFSDRLLRELNQSSDKYDLSLKAPIFDLIHPKILWTQLEHERNPEHEATAVKIPHWHYQCFQNVSEAQKSYPTIALMEGRPWNLFQFINSNSPQAIIDFAPMGATLLSREALPELTGKELHFHTLPHWLHYATSPELWGPEGKWIRFHARLHRSLEEKNLLKDKALPGYYPLKQEAQKLEEHGFLGTVLDKTYLLVLPWSFPLGALEKLEKIIQQEF